MPEAFEITAARKIAQLEAELDNLKTRMTSPLAGTDTWARIAASGTILTAVSFSIAGDWTGLLKMGTKFRCSNNGFAYGIITSSSLAGGVTTVNLVPNTSFSLNSSYSFSNVDISFGDPPDFPGWFSWPFTLWGPEGSAGAYAEDYVNCRYFLNGRKVTLKIRKRITNLGSWSGQVYGNLPIKAVNCGGIMVPNGGIWPQNGGPTSVRGWIEFNNLNASIVNFVSSVGSVMVVWSNLLVNDWIFADTSYEI